LVWKSLWITSAGFTVEVLGHLSDIRVVGCTRLRNHGTQEIRLVGRGEQFGQSSELLPVGVRIGEDQVDQRPKRDYQPPRIEATNDLSDQTDICMSREPSFEQHWKHGQLVFVRSLTEGAGERPYEFGVA
jgi:hypothetical protein